MTVFERTIKESQDGLPPTLVAASRKTLDAIKAGNKGFSFLDEVLFWQQTQIAYLHGLRVGTLKRFA